MAADFPTTVKTFTAKSNNVDTIDASHVNDLQDEVNAVETLLGASSARRTAWTPTLTFETTAPTSITYVTANTGGFFSRFGSLVYVIGRIELSAISGGSGNVSISLPITSLSGNFSLASILVNTATNWTTLFPSIGRVNASAATMRLFSYAAATGHTVVTNANVGATSAFIFSGFYFHA